MKKPWIKYAAVFLAAAGAFAFLHFVTPELMDFDSYFHAKMASLTMEKGILHSFPWMAFTFQRNNYANPYLLFHAYLGLWVKAMPAHPFAAVKLAMVALLGLVAVAFLLAVEAAHPKWVWPAAALLPALLVGQVYGRLSSIRPHVLSILILLLGIRAILKRKWWVLAALSFVYAYSYSAPVLLPVVALIASAAFSLSEKRVVWQPFAYSLGGLAAGLVVNPYFPRDIYYLYTVLFKMAARQSSIVPSELLPLLSSQILTINIVSLGVLFLGVLAALATGKKLSGNGLFLFATTGLFFGLVMLSFRYMEYWPFVAALGASAILREVFADSAAASRVMKKGLAAALCALFLVIGAVGYRSGYRHAEPIVQYVAVKDLADALDREAAPGDIVLADDWALPMGLFYATDRVYHVLMSDPEMMRLAHPGLYILWSMFSVGRVGDGALNLIRAIESQTGDAEITKLRAGIESGLIRDRLPDIIRSAFGAKWVVITHKQGGGYVDLGPLLARYPADFEHVRSNGPFSLYRLR